MATTEIQFMSTIDEHLAAFGPKTRAQVARAIEAAVTVVVDSGLDAAAIKRGMAWAVRAADEASAEADARESRRTRPSAPDAESEGERLDRLNRKLDDVDESAGDVVTDAKLPGDDPTSEAVDDFKARTGL